MDPFHERALIKILRHAYSGELGAALAYRGHWKSVKDPNERERIQKIENEEWDHRERVGQILKSLGSRPNRFLEWRLRCVGRILGFFCHLTGWFAPMYGAGLIEAKNVIEYVTAATHARALNLPDAERDLLQMADVEKEHEIFFKAVIAGHWLAKILT